MKPECVFCKLIRNKIPSYKIYEDKDFIAILDIYPNTRGMTMVLTKKHYPSYIFELPDNIYSKLLKVTKKIAKQIDNKLDVKRTAMVMEGMGIDHAHIKLYPLHGLKDKFQKILAKKRIFFNKYEGYLTTLLGPKARKEDLERNVKKLRDG